MKTLGLCIAAGLGLSACASGGTVGNTNANNVVTEYPIETAMLNIYTKQRSENLVATIGNQTASADIQVTPKGNMLFNNKRYKVLRSTRSIK